VNFDTVISCIPPASPCILTNTHLLSSPSVNLSSVRRSLCQCVLSRSQTCPCLSQWPRAITFVTDAPSDLAFLSTSPRSSCLTQSLYSIPLYSATCRFIGLLCAMSSTVRVVSSGDEQKLHL